MKYECIRREELSTTYDIPEDINTRTDWKDIDSQLVEDNIATATLINHLCGHFDKRALTSTMQEELKAGRPIILTNFYVRQKQAS